MARQPVPAGSVVAIVSDGGGAGALAADTCADVGLAVAATPAQARGRLREMLPAAASVDGPVDTTAAVSPEVFGEALSVAAGEGVDALIAVVVRAAATNLLPVLAAARLPVPVVAVVLDQPEAVRLLPGDGPGVPAYAFPEAAARALARVARYGSWRSRPSGTMPQFGDVRAEDARSIVDSFLASMPGTSAQGLTKVLFDERTGRAIGCGIVGPSAGDLIAGAALAVEMGADAADMGLIIHPHPTLSETVAVAAEAFEGAITDLYLPRR